MSERHLKSVTNGSLDGGSIAVGLDAPGRFYAPQIDGLRFIAALLVIVHHTPPVPYMRTIREIGWIGVDLFLCISAYLLTRLIRLEFQRTGDISIRRFLIRRALRIWPLYFGYATVMCLVALTVFNLPAQLSLSWLLAHLSFSANVMTALNGFSPVPFTAHLWTLPLEEQAYFAIPFVLLAISRRSPSIRTVLLGLAAVLWVVSLARVSLWLAGVDVNSILVLPTRADALILGAGSALVFENRRPPPSYLVFICVLAVFIPYTFADGPSQIILYPLVGVACTMVLLLSMESESLKAALSLRPLRYFGKISYGIYVYHLLCIAIVSALLPRVGISDQGAIMPATLIVTLAVAAASYHLYESYFLRLKERFAIVPSRAV